MSTAAQYRAVEHAGHAEAMVTKHADLVRRIAHHLAARLPASVEIDDLIQAGMIGLIEASRSIMRNKAPPLKPMHLSEYAGR